MRKLWFPLVFKRLQLSVSLWQRHIFAFPELFSWEHFAWKFIVELVVVLLWFLSAWIYVFGPIWRDVFFLLLGRGGLLIILWGVMLDSVKGWFACSSPLLFSLGLISSHTEGRPQRIRHRVLLDESGDKRGILIELVVGDCALIIKNHILILMERELNDARP